MTPESFKSPKIEDEDSEVDALKIISSAHKSPENNTPKAIPDKFIPTSPKIEEKVNEESEEYSQVELIHQDSPNQHEKEEKKQNPEIKQPSELSLGDINEYSDSFDDFSAVKSSPNLNKLSPKVSEEISPYKASLTPPQKSESSDYGDYTFPEETPGQVASPHQNNSLKSGSSHKPKIVDLNDDSESEEDFYGDDFEIDSHHNDDSYERIY